MSLVTLREYINDKLEWREITLATEQITGMYRLADEDGGKVGYTRIELSTGHVLLVQETPDRVALLSRVAGRI